MLDMNTHFLWRSCGRRFSFPKLLDHEGEARTHTHTHIIINLFNKTIYLLTETWACKNVLTSSIQNLHSWSKILVYIYIYIYI